MTTTLDKPIKILLIGPLPPPLGGATVLFQQLVNDLSKRDDIKVIVLNTARRKRNLFTNIFNWFRIVLGILWSVPHVHIVSFHTAAGGVLFLAPIIWFVGKVFRKKSVLRRFAGRSDLQYEQLPSALQWLVRRTVLNMDLVLFETKYLVRYFERLTDKPVRWFSNNRALPADFDSVIISVLPEGAKKFVFIGQVRPCKGIRQIVEAICQIKENINVDIYGPLFEDMTEKDFTADNIAYRGILSPDQVIATLKQYDVLLIPTYCSTEGYPGIILESYCAGVPVISTKLNAIPEIVDQDSGILIRPKDVEGLMNAMLDLIRSPEKFARLQQGARQKAREFSSEVWSDKFVEYLVALNQS